MVELKIYFTSIKGRRHSNEDRHNIVLNINGDNIQKIPINLFSIFDGHGGDFVSNYLYKNITKYYYSSTNMIPFNHINIFRTIQNELLKKKKSYNSGSTCLLNIMYKHKNNIQMDIINLGDSRLTIIYKNGTNSQITTDHKPDDPVEKERLKKIGGEIYKDSEGVYRIGDLSLSRAFGDADNAPYISQIPDIHNLILTNKMKYIVMACDGLWDVIDNDDLLSLFNSYKKRNSTNLAVDLVNDGLLKGSTDNISVIIIEIN